MQGAFLISKSKGMDSTIESESLYRLSTFLFFYFSTLVEKKYYCKKHNTKTNMTKYALTAIFTFILSATQAQVRQRLDSVLITEPAINIDSCIEHTCIGKTVQILTREDIKKLPVSSLSQLLDNTLGIDVRQRGSDDTQSDISIRGSSADQVLVLINGINFSDFQTGHHSMNLPLSLDDVSQIQVIEGAKAVEFGINSFAGVLNIITAPEQGHNAIIRLGIGQYGYQAISSKINITNSKLKSSLSAGYKGSKGYFKNTDFDLWHAFYSGTYKINLKSSLSFNLGFWSKNYGAYNFYTPTFPYQYEKIEGGLGSLTFKKRFSKKFKVNTSIYFRRQNEIFELFRESETWYIMYNGYFIKDLTDTAKYYPGIYEPWNYYRHHNFHQSNLSGAKSVFTYKNTGKLKYTIKGGIEIRREEILSNVLGEPSSVLRPVEFYNGAYFDKYAGRTNTSGFIYISKKLKDKGHFFIGNVSTYSTQYGFSSCLGGHFAYNITNKTNIFISANQSMREPSFTDLYYNGPTNIGNPNLKPENSISYEIGLNSTGIAPQIKMTVFYRQGRNIIDWVRENEDQKWQTMNYTKLDTYGSEIFVSYGFNRLIKYISAGYRYLNQIKPPMGLQSKYALDYMKHSAFIVIEGKYKNAGWSVDATYNDRNGSFEKYVKGIWHTQEYEPYFLLNAKIWYKYEDVNFYIQGSNLTNTQYYDISNVKLPGRWLRAGIEIEF